METPVILACIMMVILTIIFVLALNSNTKRWRGQVEYLRTRLDDEQKARERSIYDLQEAKQKLAGAETLAEQRRVRVVELEQKCKAQTELMAGVTGNDCKYKMAARVVSHLSPDGGKIASYSLDLIFVGPNYEGTLSPWVKLSDDAVKLTVRTLSASKKNRETLSDSATEINKTIADFVVAK